MTDPAMTGTRPAPPRAAELARERAPGGRADAPARAMRIIESCLADGDLRPVRDALEILGSDEQRQSLGGLVEFCATHPAAGAVRAELIAVPLFMQLSARRHPAPPPDIGDASAFARTLREEAFRLRGAEAAVLSPRLWTLEELAGLSAGQVYALAKRLDAADVPAPAAAPAPDGASYTCLRFLLAAVAWPALLDAPAGGRRVHPGLRRWRTALGQSLSERLGGIVQPFAPANFYRALRDGETQYRLAEFGVNRTAALERLGLAPADVRAVLRTHHLAPGRVSICVGCHAGDVAAPFYAYFWPRVDLPRAPAVREALVEELRHAGIRRVERQAKISSREGCAACRRA